MLLQLRHRYRHRVPGKMLHSQLRCRQSLSSRRPKEEILWYYSATGNTEEAANYIAQATGGDLFELEPVEPYTDEDLNWSDENSRVSVEHENEDQREVELVSTTVENWDSYDTVFIGYPKMEQGFSCV